MGFDGVMSRRSCSGSPGAVGLQEGRTSQRAVLNPCRGSRHHRPPAGDRRCRCPRPGKNMAASGGGWGSGRSMAAASLSRRMSAPVRVAEMTEVPDGMVGTIQEDKAGELPLLDQPYFGANLNAAGGCVFRVWAPAAMEAFVFLYNDGEASSEARRAIPMAAEANGVMVAEVDGVSAGQLYHFGFRTHWDSWHERRDTYARATQANTPDNITCVVTDPTFEWAEWDTPPLDKLVLYECHLGTFTGYHDPQIEAAGLTGTFKGAEQRLDHLVDSGFNAMQLMPVLEYSGSWGYNPRLLFPTHEGLGTPSELRSLVNTAHKRGIAVIFDCVLHHGAVKDNSLWNYDGWQENGNGGIYHEGATGTGFGTAFAFHKEEVKQMLYDSCAMFLREYNADGIRIDAAQLMPWELQQYLTYRLKKEFPGKIIIAESNPCHPDSVHGAGFQSLWDFSSTFEGLMPARSGRAAEQLDLNLLKSLLALKPGFSHPTQVVKFILGSHDQIGCRKNGGHHSDTNMVHRWPVEYMGGRDDWSARARIRMWHAIQCTAQGIPMTFMGIEIMQSGFWHIDEHHRLNWDFAADEIGQQTMEAFRDINVLRTDNPAFGQGWINFVHEDHHNGVLAFERGCEGSPDRFLVVVNSGANYQADDPVYGVRVGGNSLWAEVYNSQEAQYGGWEGSGNREGLLQAQDGQLHIRLPKYSVLVFLEQRDEKRDVDSDGNADANGNVDSNEGAAEGARQQRKTYRFY